MANLSKIRGVLLFISIFLPVLVISASAGGVTLTMMYRLFGITIMTGFGALEYYSYCLFIFY